MKIITLLSSLALSFSAGAMTLTNGSLHIEFADSEQGYDIESITSEGMDLPVNTNAAKHGASFWTLRFRAGAANDKDVIILDNRHNCRARRFEPAHDGGGTFVWEGMNLGDELNAVTVRARVAFNEPDESEWTIEVQNSSSKYGLFIAEYPVVHHFLPPTGADVLLPRPDLGARLVKNAKLRSIVRNFGCMSYYPMMLAYFYNDRGLYYAAHDSQARIKTLFVQKDQSVSFSTPVENAGIPLRAAEGPRYAVTISALKGDWWAAAKRYRRWALTTPWTAKGPIISRTDYPKLMAEIPLWLNIHGHSSAVSNVMTRAAKAFPNFTAGIHWHLWQHSGHDTNDPEYFPAQPGVPATYKYCHSINTEPMPATNGRLWTTNMLSFAALAKPYAITRWTGQPVVEAYGPQTLAPMCPATEVWDFTLNEFANRSLALGARSLFLDQIGAMPAIACFSTKHDHQPGGGTWFYDSYVKLLAKTHAAYSAKGAFLTTEGSGEEWMAVIDGYLNVVQRAIEDVPFYHAVYSGYTTYFCSSENYQDDADSFWAAQARELVWGQSLGWFHPEILNDAEKCEQLRRLCEFRQQNLDLLAYGTMEDPVRFIGALPRQSVTWLPRNPTFFNAPLKKTTAKPAAIGTLPAVEGIVWKSLKTGKRAVILGNLSPKEQSVAYNLGNGEVRRTLAPRELVRIDE